MGSKKPNTLPNDLGANYGGASSPAPPPIRAHHKTRETLLQESTLQVAKDDARIALINGAENGGKEPGAKLRSATHDKVLDGVLRDMAAIKVSNYDEAASGEALNG